MMAKPGCTAITEVSPHQESLSWGRVGDIAGRPQQSLVWRGGRRADPGDSPGIAWRSRPNQRRPYRPAAYWAAWAEALPVLGERAPALAEACVRQLEAGETWETNASATCLRSAAVARDVLRAEGWQDVHPGEQSRMALARHR